jgi:UDP-N-acetylglucosamine 2-epimerase (non-hydrolysing)
MLYSDIIDNSLILEKLRLEQEQFIVASIHREENLDIGDNFKNIIDALNKAVELYDKELIFTTHPRTKKKIKDLNLKVNSRINFIDPLGFCDYVFLQKNALITLSDSGTISEESAILRF